MKRVLIVCDGNSWFVRRVACTVQDDNRGEMVYHCDKHLGGPFRSLASAVVATHKITKSKRRKATSSSSS